MTGQVIISANQLLTCVDLITGFYVKSQIKKPVAAFLRTNKCACPLTPRVENLARNQNLQ